MQIVCLGTPIPKNTPIDRGWLDKEKLLVELYWNGDPAIHEALDWALRKKVDRREK